MTELKTADKPEYDPRQQYFVKMFKDGTYKCEQVSLSMKDFDQNTLELEYPIPEPTEEEKIKFALTIPEINILTVSDDVKRQVAKEYISKSDFVLPNPYNPNITRVHDDPEYFFQTPARPIIWTLKKGTENEAIAEAEAYRQLMLKPLKTGISKWDMVIAVYKEQYNVQEA